MTTITEILAEAFNRVKAEHGVNLSSVEFEHYSGTLSGVTFKAVGNVQPVYSYPAFPPLAGQIPVTPHAPNDATHKYGDHWAKVTADKEIYLWTGTQWALEKWYDTGYLTPLNPA